MKTHKPQLIIIGNGMVGYKFCEKLVKKGLHEEYSVTVFGEEPWVAYDRVHLSEYFTNPVPEQLEMAPRSWYEENNINLVSSTAVSALDTDSKTVTTYKGDQYNYDKLILATGSSAFVPPISGADKHGVFVYRTIEDLDNIINYAKKVKTGTVIGGGLLGLEAAKALMDLSLQTDVIEFAPRLMPRQLDETGARILKDKIEELGIKIHLNKNTKQFTGNGKVDGLEFADDTRLDTDMVVISAGIRPRDELAKSGGIETGERGGILVNDKMQTSAPDVYCIGEAALHKNMIYGLVAPGYEMADVVVNQIAADKEEKVFTDYDMSTKLKLIGVDVASFGDAMGTIEGCKSLVYENGSKGVYKRINISGDGKYLLGGILVGEAEDYNMLQQMVINKMKLPEEPESLLVKSSGDDAFGSADSLPDTAIVCSCESVTKGTLCEKVANEEANDIGELKECTKAGTGCGGCLPMVKDLMTATMKSMGKEVKKEICEHFPLSRQELFHVIKVKGYKSYQEVLEHEGSGCGCEICKPAVASILATLWNEPIIEQDTIQDTNDRFLANIQRGGTYSVVPRVPAGEITPEKLIVLGDVAKKYDLYCKITGGQRIDLFGAQLNDLPAIWEELIAAGFESGHAYGKSVRTVKSCVGSTWCRYGVQDSVSMAVYIEERYKGLRSPHKLKFAVSGCVRECAEAQSKDVGVIATDNGWNLFIAGNGGVTPQHGTLFGTDISSENLIKYIDRFLMFYVQTADPLQRTAPWFNKLEGGLDYLRDVIINDSLGICSELDAMMQHHVDTYVCEWKDAIENEEKRSKFTHFVNTDERDETIEFVDMRGQKVPAPW